jgi:cell division protein FtsI (penicillin-binding protein 3)
MTMKKISYINWRLVLVCSCLSLAVMSVTYRMISLQLEDSAFLQNEGKKRYIKYRTLNPVRGTIFDRNNFPLAVSIVNYDLYALRGLNIDRFLKIKDNIALEDIMISGPSFSRKTLLKKNLTKEEQLLVNKLNFNELEMEVRHSRHYPLGDQISPLIGFYGTDGAQEGIEKSYDPFLSGVQGRQKYYTNAKQEIISKPIEVSENISGNDLQLTIDSTIQFYAYKYLVESIISNKAKAGTVIILDNKKGEVLAIASYPSYNPNSPKRVIQKNRALVEAYELGSVLKPIVFSKAVDLKLLNPDEYIDIPRRLQLGSKVISDTKSYNKLTPKEIIAYSSQVGASKIALLLGYDALKANYYNFGFSGPISINFPSSAFGLINAKEKISDREVLVTVTGLQ